PTPSPHLHAREIPACQFPGILPRTGQLRGRIRVTCLQTHHRPHTLPFHPRTAHLHELLPLRTSLAHASTRNAQVGVHISLTQALAVFGQCRAWVSPYHRTNRKV